jgi:TAF6 C-terminal HEAT repeat domain
VITCVVAKHLAPDDDHYSLRKMSADLLLTISQYSGATYPGLQARITKTLVRALLDQSKPPQTLFGAIYALWRMGPEVVDLLIVPNACALCSRVNLETAPETHKLIVQVLKGHFDRITSGSKDEASVKKWTDVYGPFASFVFQSSDDVEMS